MNDPHGYSSTWRTSDELRFLSRLGEHRSGDFRVSDKIRLLRNYLIGCDLRNKWAPLDQQTIRKHAASLIEQYQHFQKGTNAEHQHTPSVR